MVVLALLLVLEAALLVWLVIASRRGEACRRSAHSALHGIHKVWSVSHGRRAGDADVN